MTFSFRPRSSSRLPMIAASVSTRVVSWNDAAEINESVDNDAFAAIHYLPVVRHHVLVLGDQKLVCNAFEIGDHQTLLALGIFAERYRAGNLCKQARIFR